MATDARDDRTDGRDDKTRILHRLRRLEGQVRGLQKMIEDDRTCHDVLALCSGIRSALDATTDLVLERYVRECQEGAADGNDAAADVVRAVRLARN